MKISNPFFKKNDNIKLKDILKILKIKKNYSNIKINDIRDLSDAKKNDISFFNNIKYFEKLKKSNVKFVISSEKYFSKIKEYCEPIIVSNILKSVYSITELFYPDSLNDSVDLLVMQPEKKKF